MKTKVKLPDKPSELIRVALADLVKCERSKNYRINMDEWHSPVNDKCEVCLAGAVMAKTLMVSPGEHYLHIEFDDDTEKKLWDLEEYRNGFMPTRYEFPCREVTHYATDPKQFKSDMRKLADDLEAAGL